MDAMCLTWSGSAVLEELQSSVCVRLTLEGAIVAKPNPYRSLSGSYKLNSSLLMSRQW